MKFGRFVRTRLAGYTEGMGRSRPAASVTLLCGLLSGDADLLRRARQRLTRHFGPVELESEIWPFSQTTYYSAEMGPDLLRQFVAFERPVRAERLHEAKQLTNALEAEMAEACLALGPERPINIDPGYVDSGKLVLATTKDRAHRVYLGGGIFAEATLHYADGRWQPWPWTYPDYHEPHYHTFFDTVREALLKRRREQPEPMAGEGPTP
jgi:Domain of unknown function (DUF4416)